MTLSLVSDDRSGSRLNRPQNLSNCRRPMAGALLICCLTAVFHARPAFAKQRVDLIVVHGTVVTMDGTRRILTDGAIAVQGDAIAAIDSNANIDVRYESGKVIDARGGLVLPG